MGEQMSWLDLPREKTRQEQILEEMERFLALNPGLWGLFCRFTFEAIDAGKQNYSAYAIFERMRWHVEIETRGEPVKLNNNYRPYFARMWAIAYPAHKDFFRTRICRSAERPAGAGGLVIDREPDPEEETHLTAILRRMIPKSP